MKRLAFRVEQGELTQNLLFRGNLDYCRTTLSERCGAFLGLVIVNLHNTFSILD